MLRFIWFLILLLAGCALIFWPFQAEIERDAAFSRRASRPLPQAWENAVKLQVRPLSGAALGPCGAVYTVSRGDTLGEIARRCEVSLNDLLAANSQIRNPNRIEAGLPLALPGAAVPGGIPETSRPAYPPGEVLEVEIDGLPPNRTVRVGLGLSSTGYQVVDRVVTTAEGRLVARVTLPEDARTGDSAFIMAAAEGVPAAQAISDTFLIASP